MSDERVIASRTAKSVATFSIFSEGVKVPGRMQVLSVLVEREINRIPSATITIQDGAAAEQSFAVSNGEEFAPGKRIDIHAGYRSDEERIFSGIVISQSVKVRKNVSMLVVECRHEAVRMSTRPVCAYFHEVTDQDVADALFAAHGLSVSTSGSAVSHAQLVQYESTDWDFMLCRAEANGWWVIAGDDGVTVGPPDFSRTAELTVQYGATIHDLDAEMDSRVQYETLRANGWDPANQELISPAEAADPGAPAAGNIAASDLAAATGNDALDYRHAGVNESEMQAWADGAMRKRRLGKIRGTLRTDGTALAVPGNPVIINGAGERFEGTHMMTGVRHQIGKGNWETTIQFGESPERFAERFRVHQPAAAALIPPVHGLQIGVVTSLEDPLGEDRIQVRLPLVHPSDEGAWMRMASPDAGSSRGMIFRPEIADEVIVGFINNDPRHGVVLGMLHSSAHAAPLPGSNDNHEKGYVSRSGIRLHFDDDKTIVTLSTPGGHTLVLDDNDASVRIEDSNGNKLVMNSDGIGIESVRDLKLKAAADLTAEAGANAEFTAGASAKVEGGAGAELSAGGNTTVKGAMVQIN
jgi:Rhs element Vgr protein